MLRLALPIFTRCIGCDWDAPTFETFPLCQSCLGGLIASPRLCESCFSPGCLKECTRPWIRSESLDSQFALFQLTDQAYRTLRRWKSSRGPLFDQRVFKQADQRSVQDYVNEHRVESFIPMPQNYARSWKMGGSPANVLASWLSKVTRIPKENSLRRIFKNEKRQAELSGWQRMQTRLRFELHPKAPIRKSVLLVDDFSTTGHTLAEAARLLKQSGFLEVHALCLGAKLLRGSDRRRLDWEVKRSA